MTHGVRIDLTGQKIGCYTVIGIAASRKAPNGTTKGYWQVQCVCGKQKEVAAQKLLTRAPQYCYNDCGLKRVNIVCKCGVTKLIEKSRLTRLDGRPWRCQRCAALAGAAAVRGKPAHNRLPNDEGGLNYLFSSYVRGAANRGLAFSISKAEFKQFTKQECYYCGAPPSSIKVNKKGTAPPYLYNGLDRLSVELGYESENVVSCCSVCNYMKQELSFDDFIKKIEAIYKKRCTRIVPPRSGRRVFMP